MKIPALHTVKLTAAAVICLLAAGCAIRATPVSNEQKIARMQADLAAMFAGQDTLTEPLGMYEAMARAIKYNLDHQVKLMEEAVAVGAANVSRYSMLPTLTAGAGYNTRSNESGASSRSLLTGTESLEPSTSQEKTRDTADLRIAWNVLDFGVSYAQAQQKSNETLIHREQLRKVTNNIIQEVRGAYWRALSAQQLLPEMDDLLQRTETALQQSREMENLRIQDPMKALNYQQSLLKIIAQMWKMRQDLSTARSELAALINLKPGSQFELKDDTAAAGPHTRILTPVDRLETLALSQRPELNEADYKARLDALDVRIAMLRMFPGLEINGGYNYDSNEFLFNNSWADAGLRLSWNLFNIFSGPAEISAAKTRQDLGNTRRLALNMAVLTQVNVAFQNYHLALKDYQIAAQQHEVESRILDQTLTKQMAARENELEVLKMLTSTLSAKMRLHIAEAEKQNALGRLAASVGIDPLPATVTDTSIKGLAGAIEQHITGWTEKLESGDDEASGSSVKADAK